MCGDKFKGFPRNASSLPVPVIFFNTVLPHINDIDELKVMLSIFKLIKYKRGNLRFVTLTELMNNKIIRAGVSSPNEEYIDDAIKKAVNLAVEDGLLLDARLVGENSLEEVYIINQEPDKTTLEKILSGTLQIPSLELTSAEDDDLPLVENIYKLYEQNIGIITPLIAEELKRAEQSYPPEWIKDAFEEAVKQNIRNWKYISRILERWTEEGKTDGKAGRYLKKEKDRDRFIKGKYGHLVRRRVY
jgi:DnaD/phage-associated family protein